jgi:hypothetical protein
MIRLIKNWWLNRKRQKEWLEWGKRNPEQLARLGKVIGELEFPELKKYRDEDNPYIYKPRGEE